MTIATRQIGVDDHQFACPEPPAIGHHATAQFMADDPWIFQIGMLALQDMVIRSAQPHGLNIHQNLPRRSGCRARPVDQRELAGFDTDSTTHH